jgi:hypothetical protein
VDQRKSGGFLRDRLLSAALELLISTSPVELNCTRVHHTALFSLMYETAVKDALDVILLFYNPRFEGDGKSRLQRQRNGVITLGFRGSCGSFVTPKVKDFVIPWDSHLPLGDCIAEWRNCLTHK